MISLSSVQLLQQQPGLWLTLVIIFSLAIGSFLNVVIYRLPRFMQQQWRQECLHFAAAGRHLVIDAEAIDRPLAGHVLTALAWPNSHCPHCKTPLKAWHNIPVLSYLFLAGRCAFCKHKISLHYPTVELLTAILSTYAVWVLGFDIPAMISLLLIYTLIALAGIDVEHKLLLDQLTLPLLWLGLLVNVFGLFCSLEEAVWGAMAGYLSLWSVYWLFRLVTGKQGMGYGDFKLLAALGAWLGWQALPMIVMIAGIGGVMYGVLQTARGGHTDRLLPFGPFLALGGYLYLVYGPQLWALWY